MGQFPSAVCSPDSPRRSWLCRPARREVERPGCDLALAPVTGVPFWWQGGPQHRGRRERPRSRKRQRPPRRGAQGVRGRHQERIQPQGTQKPGPRFTEQRGGVFGACTTLFLRRLAQKVACRGKRRADNGSVGFGLWSLCLRLGSQVVIIDVGGAVSTPVERASQGNGGTGPADSLTTAGPLQLSAKLRSPGD